MYGWNYSSAFFSLVRSGGAAISVLPLGLYYYFAAVCVDYRTTLSGRPISRRVISPLPKFERNEGLMKQF